MNQIPTHIKNSIPQRIRLALDAMFDGKMPSYFVEEAIVAKYALPTDDPKTTMERFFIESRLHTIIVRSAEKLRKTGKGDALNRELMPLYRELTLRQTKRMNFACKSAKERTKEWYLRLEASIILLELFEDEKQLAMIINANDPLNPIKDSPFRETGQAPYYDLTQEYEELASENEELTQENEELLSENEKLARQNKRLISRNEELARRSNSLTRYSDKQTERIKKLSDRNLELTRQNEEMNSRNEELTSQNEEQASRIDELVSRGARQIRWSERQTKRNKELNRLNEELTSQNEELTNQNEELTSQNEKLTSQNQRLTCRVERLKKRLNSLPHENQSSASLNLYKSRAERAEQSVLELEQKLSELEQKVAESEQKRSELEQKLSVAEQKLSESEQKRSVAEQKVSELEQKVGNLTGQLEQKQKEQPKLAPQVPAADCIHIDELLREMQEEPNAERCEESFTTLSLLLGEKEAWTKNMPRFTKLIKEKKRSASKQAATVQNIQYNQGSGTQNNLPALPGKK